MPRHDEIAAAAESMMQSMFAPHELPLDDELKQKYWATAKDALKAVEQVRRLREGNDEHQVRGRFGTRS